MSSTGEEQSTLLSTTVRTFEDFAVADVFSGDIDPTYWAIHRAYNEFGADWTKRFCVGMLCYYHTGTAAKAADLEGDAFWNFIKSSFATVPMVSERRWMKIRHGEAAMAIKHLAVKFPDPSSFFDKIPRSYTGIKGYCEKELTWHGALSMFGPYFQLKIADYMDRCLYMPLTSYAGLESNLPGPPLKGALLLYPSDSKVQAFIMACQRVYALGLMAPPAFDRMIGPAEVETILCDYIHAKQGTSWVGKDVADKHASFNGFGGKAAQMADWMPPVIAKNSFKLELL
jgi:hypothetical protein